MLKLPVFVFEEEVEYGPKFPLLIPFAFPNLLFNWVPASAAKKALEEQEMEMLQYKVWLIIFINACRELLN